ncbi:MAG: nicotinate-nucleotide--dimethylbenzimidazole phosphoribosyltransferase [Spirochaetaceae bacterium]|nr:nicotinate-nucleotide--dimethylbenzimidazole phosphoribosyltransferase [Spirochaetaceae bacterium]
MNPAQAEKLINDTITSIKPLDGDALKAASRRMDALLKPPGSLGRLEELGIKLAGIQGTDHPAADGKLSLIYAGDHGVSAEGVSASPPFVSAVMVKAFCAGKAGINVLAGKAGAVVKVIDVGVATPYKEPDGLIVRRIRKGTGNLRVESAMSREEALLAMAAGIETARDAIAETGAKIVGIGEMGIGNTTSAAALTAVFTNRDPATVTGGGTGIGDASLKKKIKIIKEAIKLHQPDPADPISVMAKLGGLEIAAMCGAMLASAADGAMVLIDGFISGAGALTAFAMAPVVRERMVLSHLSAERGHRAMAAKLELKPLLDLGFRLGEGTGAGMAMPLIEAGAALLSEMGTLEEELIKLKDPS